jgi:hypothetical protein
MKIIFYIIAFLMLCSCHSKNNNNTNNTKKISTKQIDRIYSENMPRSIYLKDSLLFVKNHSKIEYPIIEVWDIKNKSKVNKFGQKGKGPSEFLYLQSLFFDYKLDIGYVFDRVTRNLYSFPIDELNSEITIQKVENFNTEEKSGIRNIMFTESGNILISGYFEHGRLKIVNESGLVINIFQDWPDCDFYKNKSLSNMELGFASQDKIVKHPLVDLYASIIIGTDIIEFFKITNNQIQRIFCSDFKYPINKEKITINGNTTFKTNNTGIIGLLDVTVSENHVFCLINDFSDCEKEERYNSNKIIVYNWDGKLEYTLELDKRVFLIEYYKTENQLIGIETYENLTPLIINLDEV